MLKNLSTDGKNKKSNGKMLSNTDLSSFCEQMAMIIDAGITATEGLYIMEEETTGAQGKSLLKEMIENMEAGFSFSETLENTKAFPDYMIKMVKVGEMAGKLDVVFDSLANYYKKEEHIKNSVKQSVFYPIVMVVMMLAVVGFLLVKVMPTFESVFRQLGTELTGFAGSVMALANAVSTYAIWIVVALGVILILGLAFTYTEGGQKAFRRFKENSRLTKDIVEKIAVARFANGMALMLASGLDTRESLELASQLTQNTNLKAKIEKCRESLDEGTSFAKVISDNKIFGGLYARMLAVGFKTGAVDNVMEEISVRYEEEVDRKLSRAISIIEPTLVAVLSIVVGMILLSVMLPLISIMSTLG